MKKNEKEIRFLTSEFRIAASADPKQLSRKIEGYAVVFNKDSLPIWDSFVESIDQHAFDKCNMDGCVLNYQHNNSDILARKSSGTLDIQVDEKGVFFRTEMPDTSLGNDLLALIKRGDISQCSFCFTVASEQWSYPTKDEEKSGVLAHRKINEIDNLYDLSLVVNPAYSDTSVSARALELCKNPKNELEQQRLKELHRHQEQFIKSSLNN